MANQCGLCGAVGDGLLRCSLCLSAYYCNRDCQVQAWKQGHKKTCSKAAGVPRPTIAYPLPFARATPTFADRITAASCDELMDQGYTVIDNFLGSGWAHALLAEIKYLWQEQLMVPNKTQFPSTTKPGAVAQFDKPHIFEADLHNAAARTRVPELEALFHQDDLVAALMRHTALPLVAGTQGKTLKVQYNAGHGGCFPCHYDNPGRPNKRRLTCLLYLNPAWKEGDGGEIQFYPFLGTPVVISPLMDRLVVFGSDRVLHRVLPSQTERHCLTVWIDGDEVNTDGDTQLSLTASDLAENWDSFVAKLARSPVQRLLSRGVYAEEYLESLTQCMEEAPDGYMEMVHSHETHLARLQLNPPLLSLVNRLRAHRGVSALVG
ncbi:Aste57867_11454 [Aphanomyces stellatus]|uniref:Aste57867_11454 protein n=1 Tax=Aphanomyces stellatus TaxID=120398 RepID=A0A485KTJ9_9STRA|nr:hypothetical protein As57867_011411 [Aphanomyces stellatus]VFT88315.1 Aste57867_11454 [Aphanomyces stellatus]